MFLFRFFTIGVVFLSGGQSELDATINLNACNTLPGKKPWALTFSYGRALQHSVIRGWAGKAENLKAAQDTLNTLATNNGLASMGKYVHGSNDPATAGDSLFVAKHAY